MQHIAQRSDAPLHYMEFVKWVKTPQLESHWKERESFFPSMWIKSNSSYLMVLSHKGRAQAFLRFLRTALQSQGLTFSYLLFHSHHRPLEASTAVMKLSAFKLCPCNSSCCFDFQSHWLEVTWTCAARGPGSASAAGARAAFRRRRRLFWAALFTADKVKDRRWSPAEHRRIKVDQ